MFLPLNPLRNWPLAEKVTEQIFSSFIGPTIIAAIINATNNQWSGFPICVFLQILPICIIWRVNMKKAALDIKMYEEEERQKKLADSLDGNSSAYKEEVNEPVERKFDNEKTEEFYWLHRTRILYLYIYNIKKHTSVLHGEMRILHQLVSNCMDILVDNFDNVRWFPSYLDYEPVFPPVVSNRTKE